MADDGVEVFIRWVRRHGVTSDTVRACFTVATLVCDYDTLSRLWDKTPRGLLDELLVEDFLSLADPQEVVEMLTFRIGRDISPEMFKRVVDRTLVASSDIKVLSGLMFVAGLYLDRHPGAFALPLNLANQLLESDDVDHRLAGLKALRHSMASSSAIVAQIATALKQDDWQERWAGLSQLEQLLEEKGLQLQEAIEQKQLDELRNILTRMVDTASDANARRTAAHCSRLLQPGGDP